MLEHGVYHVHNLMVENERLSKKSKKLKTQLQKTKREKNDLEDENECLHDALLELKDV